MNKLFLVAVLTILLFAGCAQEKKTSTSEITSETQATAPDETTSTLAEKKVSTTSTTPFTPPTTIDSLPGTFVAKTSDIKEGGYQFKYQGDEAILFQYQGQYLAYSRKCTHAGCPVNFREGKLICPCHGSEFSVSTGEVLKGPAKEPLNKLQIFVQDEKIYIK